jgi:putative transposase
VKKTYQTSAICARHAGDVIVPDEVTISLGEVVESAKEGILALAVGTGLKVMEAMFAEDTDRLCGPKSKHNEQPAGYQHGRAPVR